MGSKISSEAGSKINFHKKIDIFLRVLTTKIDLN